MTIAMGRCIPNSGVIDNTVAVDNGGTIVDIRRAPLDLEVLGWMRILVATIGGNDGINGRWYVVCLLLERGTTAAQSGQGDIQGKVHARRNLAMIDHILPHLPFRVGKTFAFGVAGAGGVRQF